MKSFSSTFIKLLSIIINEGTIVQSDLITTFFVNGADVVKCCIPFSVYRNKLANLSAKICALYSRLNQDSIVLSFDTLRSLIVWAQNTELFENSLKKMYNEFTKESKSGGGGL